MKCVLFVCVENACRSQMAEGFVRHHGSPYWQAFSAGSQPAAAVNPQAIIVMQERGIDLSAHRCKGLADIPEAVYDVVVTMGCGDACPMVSARRHEEWSIRDPSGMSLEGFRSVCDQIERHVLDLLRGEEAMTEETMMEEAMTEETMMEEAMTEEERTAAAQSEDLGKVGHTVKDGIVESLRGLNEIEAEIVGLVRNTVADTLRASGSVTTETLDVTQEVIKGALRAADETGTGIITSVKSVTKGIVLGVGDVGGDVLNLANLVVRGVVTAVAELGGDVGLAARGAVQGVVEAAKEMGLGVEATLKATAIAAVDLAGSVGTAAVGAVRDVLVGTAEGVKDVLSAVVPSSGKSSEPHQD